MGLLCEAYGCGAGDQLLIGIETAKQLGMGTTMYTTEELLKARSPA